MQADKELLLKGLNNRSLYESMNPSEEGPKGYPGERVDEAEPRSLRWILSINKACDNVPRKSRIEKAGGKRSSGGERKRNTPFPASPPEKIKTA
jgi:hypothetical protein